MVALSHIIKASWEFPNSFYSIFRSRKILILFPELLQELGVQGSLLWAICSLLTQTKSCFHFWLKLKHVDYEDCSLKMLDDTLSPLLFVTLMDRISSYSWCQGSVPFGGISVFITQWPLMFTGAFFCSSDKLALIHSVSHIINSSEQLWLSFAIITTQLTAITASTPDVLWG